MAKKLKLKKKLKQTPAPELPQKRTSKTVKDTKSKMNTLPGLEGLKSFKWLSTTYKGRKWVKYWLDFREDPALFDHWQEALRSEDVTGALVEVVVAINHEDWHRFDVEEATKYLQSAFYLKPIVPKVEFSRGVKDMVKKTPTEDAVSHLNISPLEHVQNFIDLRNPVNAEEASKIALAVIEGYLPDFKGLLKEVERPSLSQIRYEGVRKSGKKLKTSKKVLKKK